MAKSIVFSSGLIALPAILPARLVRAQAFSVLHNFVRPPAYPTASLVKGKDGNYYGTTLAGGEADKGTVFRLDSVGNLTVIHSFLGSDGSGPEAALIQATDGNFYGTTFGGGVKGCNDSCGTVFKMDSSGNLTTLYRFTGVTDGGSAARLLQAGDGNFYGTSRVTTSDFGVIFKMDPGGNFTTFYKFSGGVDGGAPNSLILASDANLYGTTTVGGAYNNGTAFRINSAGKVTTLHSFNKSEGEGPFAFFLQATDGNFYGAASGFSGTVFGSIFKMDSEGNITTLHRFTGFIPGNLGFIQANDGRFYGTMEFGGVGGDSQFSQWGSVFEMDLFGNLTTLYSFTGGPDGSYPFGGPVQATDGSFYGTTELGGGWNGGGTVFKLDSLGNLTTFDLTGSDGAFPIAGLIQATDGNFYGTAIESGKSGFGTVFKIDSGGNLTTLHSFTGDSGFPAAQLIQASDGNFYGTTAGGGRAENSGTVFRIDSSGNLTTLHRFTNGSDLGSPGGSLIQAADGNLYGTTPGSIFKLDLSGNLTTLNTNRSNAGLVQAKDGDFYGTTDFGGAAGYGSAFKMDAAGNVTTLYSFVDGPDGSAPEASLIQATDGNFYGTTSGVDGSDTGGQSTVFKIDELGNLTTLYRFTGEADGFSPAAGLIQGSDGNFYGTTIVGGAYHYGTVFKIDSSGNLTTLHSFTNGSDGGHPGASLLQASDGHYYGTTTDGGNRGGGTIFEIDTSGAGQSGDVSRPFKPFLR